MVKQLKNRYNDTATNRKFLLNINRAKMKVSDIQQQHTNLVAIPAAPPPKQKGQKFEDWNF
jgi:hypothetical protein